MACGTVIAAVLLVACQHQAEPAAKRYHLEGTVVSVDLDQEVLVVNHGPIPGFMGAMTMGYAVRDRHQLAGLSPGDEITADVVVQGTDSWLEHIVVVKKASGAPQAFIQARPPQPGELVPDFDFINQFGRDERFSRFHGKAVLLTFIYTRCPLPNFCPLMNLNLAEINLALARSKQLYAETHLLSVSFDPLHDTPSVLRTYGTDFVARTDPHFRHWEFVAVPSRELRTVPQFFGLSYLKQGTQIVHSMSTTLVSPDGRVYRWYGGNDWQPAEVLRNLSSLLHPGKAQE
jgi:protein SCO1